MTNEKFDYDDEHYVNEEDDLYTYNVKLTTDLSRTEVEKLLEYLEGKYFRSYLELNFTLEDD